MIPHIEHVDEDASEERVGEPESQTFQSDPSLFDKLPRTNDFSEYFIQFQHIALQEGWNVQVDSVRKDSASNIIVSCMIRCLMHDKKLKCTAIKKNNPEREKRRPKHTKTNCQSSFSIK